MSTADFDVSCGILKRFVRDSQGFRSQMGRCDVLISGNFVIQYLERVSWKDSDVDIFVRREGVAEAFGDYKTAVEGYEFVHTKDNGPSTLHTIPPHKLTHPPYAHTAILPHHILYYLASDDNAIKYALSLFAGRHHLQITE